MNQWYQRLSKDQISFIYKNQKRQIGKYFALWSESGHLNKYMVTLSPTHNFLLDTIALRKHFFKILSNYKSHYKFEVAYFSAIEIKLNKTPLSAYTHMTELNRLKATDHNYHMHIQLFTDMKKSDLQAVLSKINPALCIHYKISTPTKQNAKYDYVIKDIKTIDWQLQHTLKTQFKRKIIYTSSRKSFANFIITKLWDHMRRTYKSKWNNIQDKYSFILKLKKSGELIIGNKTHTNQPNNLNQYDVIHIKNKGIKIYLKQNVL